MRTLTVYLLLACSTCLQAQDTISLFECYRQARENAPRLGDREIVSSIGDLRQANRATDWYPSLDLNGKVSYQSDVVTIALADPLIPVEFPEVPHDQYGFNLDITQTLYDGGMSRKRRDYNRAETAAELQEIEVDLYGMKERVNRLFFPLLILQENRKSLEIQLDNLVNQRALLETAFREGSVMESDLKVMDVEILRNQKSMVEITAAKRVLLGALGVLCGETYQDDAQLSIPRLEILMESEGSRPELQWFDLKEATMESGKDLVSSQRLPVVYAFGQTGYGKPGFNMLSGEWDFYYLAGAGFRWNIWDWNRNRREIQVISNQQQILHNQRQSFQQELESLKRQEESRMEQHRESIELDEKVLVLQQEIAERASAELSNGTITATAYITELNKVNLTRINLATHRISLIQSMANYLTIQGIL